MPLCKESARGVEEMSQKWPRGGGACHESDWTKRGDKRRHVIRMDRYLCPSPREGCRPQTCKLSRAMPKNFEELTDWWEGQEGMSPTAKSFVISAPDAYPWTDMNNHWSVAVQFTSSAGQGLSDHLYYQRYLPCWHTAYD